MDRLAGDRWLENYPKPESEKKIIRSIVKSVNPDVLAIQEMGGAPLLEEFWQDLNSSGIGNYKHCFWAKGREGEERHLALLSRLPLEVCIDHSNLELQYFNQKLFLRRGLMEVTFRTSGIEWRLFNLHLKSKWTERDDDPQSSMLREKEARCIRDFIRQNHPPESNSMHLIVGDFNDFKKSAPLRRFLQVNKTVLHHMLPCRDFMGRFWTHHYAKQDSYDRIDYMLASPAMFNAYVPDSGRIADHFRCLEGSDHRMIYADFFF